MPRKSRILSHFRRNRLLYWPTIVGVGRRSHSTRLFTRLSDWSQITPSDVDSSGSTNPAALPIPTTFLTHARSYRPVTNFTGRVVCTFGFLARNSRSASSSETKVLQ